MGKIAFVREQRLLDVTPLENVFITQYMPEASGLAVKAYLYGLMLVACPTEECDDVAYALGCSDEELFLAYVYWSERGLVRILSDSPLRVQYLNIKYNTLNARIAQTDTRYATLLADIQAIIGTRLLSGAELSKIYDWIDVFGLDEDSVCLIIEHCINDKGPRVSVAYMDAVARTVANAGNLTLEAVKGYFADELLLKGGAAAILKRLNKRRMPTKDELDLYEKWCKEWSYDQTSIEIACEEMTGAGTPSFKYIDSVLESWRAEGVVGIEAIEKKRKQDDIIHELARSAFERAGIKRKPSSEDRLSFREWHIDWCISAELIFLAAELSNNCRSQFGEMKRLISEWHNNGISSVASAKAYYESYQRLTEPRTRKKVNRALNYNQGNSYTMYELKSLGISFGEEFYKNDED